MPKLSILLPTYNGEAFLAEQLESILAQTDGDFELLVIDDGSTDRTVAVLDEFSERDWRISRLRSTGNAGQNVRLMDLLGHARGEFVAIADQDDRWAPDRNAVLLQAIGDRQMAYGRSELIDKSGKEMGLSLLDLLYGDDQSNETLSSLIQPMFSAHAMIIKREAISIEAFSRSLPFDWLLGLGAVFSKGIAYCDEAIVFHRLHDNNQCNIFERNRKIVSRSNFQQAFMFRVPARLRLIAEFDYLGRCPHVPPDLRRTFLKLAQECQTIWFSEWRALRSHHAGLREQITSALAPLAGSQRDLERFRCHIDVLTRSRFSGAVFAEIGRRFKPRVT